jgi:hypothetical protein
MPINQLIREGKIDATKGANLYRAFEYALRELGLVDRADALTNIVAEKIIEVGATAATDPEEIARAAIRSLSGRPVEVLDQGRVMDAFRRGGPANAKALAGSARALAKWAMACCGSKSRGAQCPPSPRSPPMAMGELEDLRTGKPTTD